MLFNIHPGLKETPSQEDWLISVLPENSKVGVDPWIIAAGVLVRFSLSCQCWELSINKHCAHHAVQEQRHKANTVPPPKVLEQQVKFPPLCCALKTFGFKIKR